MLNEPPTSITDNKDILEKWKKVGPFKIGRVKVDQSPGIEVK